MRDQTMPSADRPAPGARAIWQRIADGLTMLIVSAMALLLLVYLGYGEAHQRYARYILTGATTQGEIIRGTVETNLRNGVTITQLAGFGTIAKPIIDADNGVAGIRLVDRSGATVFSADEGESINGRTVLAARGRGASDARGSIDQVRDSAHVVVVMPIHDRFETVGHLLVSVPRQAIDSRVRESFLPLIVLAGGLSLLFAVSAAVLSQEKRRTWLTGGYVVIFLVTASSVTWTMIALYSQGVAAKTDASAESLAHRLKDVPGFNLNFDQFDDVDVVLAEYRRLDPDIAAAALIVNDVVAIHTTPAAVGKRWVKDEYSFEHWSDISNPAASANRILVAVSVPRQVVVSEVTGSIRDFAALLVASGFFAALFFRFAGIMSDRVGGPAGGDESARATQRGLALARPLFFLAVFVEHLNYPFLPQYVLGVLQGVEQQASLSAAPFAGYYLAFALSLIPGGWLCRRLGTKRLVSVGLCIAGFGLAILPVATDAVGLTVARVVAGTGQGLLFIGIQSYVIALSGSAKRTQGAAIIVFGFQGGMISGTAIGSLLVGYLGPAGVFLLSAIIAAIVLLYAIVLLPGEGGVRSEPASGASGMRGLLKVLRPDFLATMLLIGIPAKAVMTGVVLFGLPLLLAGRGFPSGAIGQLIMLYGLSVLAASEWVARVIDRSGATRQSLFWGAILGGIGLVIVGAMRQPNLAGASNDVVLLLAGIVVLGAAHGLINAPIVTAISDSDAARLLGVDHVTAAYRLLERIGHVLGPVLVSRIFAHAGQESEAFVWIGVGVMILGLAYMASGAAGMTRSSGATAP